MVDELLMFNVMTGYLYSSLRKQENNSKVPKMNPYAICWSIQIYYTINPFNEPPVQYVSSIVILSLLKNSGGTLIFQQSKTLKLYDHYCWTTWSSCK